MCKLSKYVKKEEIETVASVAVTLGVTKLLMDKIFGGMSTMFGEKTPQKLAEEMMAGAVRGILDHMEYKVDELKRENNRLQEKINEQEEKIEELQNTKKK